MKETTTQRDWEGLAILQHLRQEQRKHEMILRFGLTAPHLRQKMAREIVHRVINRLAVYGFPVATTTHKCPFDLWVGDLRVEVKGSHWRQAHHCYQASIRNHAADMLIFDAINGQDHFFIIPMPAVAPRKTVEVRCYNVEASKGQWAAYLERWDILVQLVENRPMQLMMGTA
jgi:hypothetical protein